MDSGKVGDDIISFQQYKHVDNRKVCYSHLPFTIEYTLYQFYLTSTDNYLDCLLVACLRKVQEWSFVSILAEFRQWVWPHRLFDFEQLVEHFDKSLVDLSVSSPDYLLTHVSLQVASDDCYYD